MYTRVYVLHLHVYEYSYYSIYFQRKMKSDCLGCAVLLCLVVSMTLLASFFLPSYLSSQHVYTIMAIHKLEHIV